MLRLVIFHRLLLLLLLLNFLLMLVLDFICIHAVFVIIVIVIIVFVFLLVTSGMVAPFKFDHTHSETKAATPALPSVDGDDWCQPTLLFLWSRLLFFLLLQIVLGTKQSIMRFGKRSIPYTKQHANTTTNGFALAPQSLKHKYRWYAFPESTVAV